jgi:hypothetical protein
MFVRIKFPYTEGTLQTTNYLILYEYQFSATSTYDTLELSQIFSQTPLLMMIVGSQRNFHLSGSLFIKTEGNDYVVDGLYNASFNKITFTSPKHIARYFRNLANCWNDGTNNTKVSKFAIEYVDTFNEPSNDYTIREYFIPDSFLFSITSREAMTINISLSGKIGTPISE